VRVTEPAGGDQQEDAVLDDRARLRTRRVTGSMATGMAARAVAPPAPLLTIPIVLRQLGEATFGVWMTVASLTALVAFADLGMGAALLTRLTPLLTQRRYPEARSLLVAGYVTLIVMALSTTVVLWTSLGWLPWGTLLNAPDSGEAALIAVATVSAFVLNIPASLIVRVQQAAQEVSASNIWAAAAAALTVPVALVLVHLDTRAWVLVMCLSLTPLIVNVANACWFFARHPELRPFSTPFSTESAKVVIHGGRGFLALSILMVAAVSFDNLIVTHAIGAAAVTALALPVRVFSQVGQLCTMLTTPLWAINGEALAHADLAWIRSNVRRMTRYTVVITVLASVIAILARDPLFVTFLGLSTAPSMSLLVALTAWWLLLAGLSPRFMVMNAASIVRLQVKGWMAFIVIALPMKVWLVPSVGLEAVVWVGVGVYIVTVLPAALLGYRRALTPTGPQTVGKDIQ
jgi:O-antigen/teichoic acid export membrane protein